MKVNHQTISEMCADLGKEPLLVQGAGGNVSWKEGGALWIKGSGTWLANALDENIFVPVHLEELQKALASEDFDAKPQTIGEQTLRPSIETILHALMPQKVVVHLHAIHALSHLVRKDCQPSINAICQKAGIKSAFVSYHKPGPQLAKAIHQALAEKTEASVIFLKNHGIVIGGNSIEEVKSLLKVIDIIFSEPQTNTSDLGSKISQIDRPENGYTPFHDNEVQALALNKQLFKRLKHDWVLFPDHAVFLGANANVYSTWVDFHAQPEGNHPELIFIKDVGVFVKPEFNKAKTAQLRCYYDVISRVPPTAELDPLSPTDVSELLNWDAEKLRQQMSQK
jgi:rhamnose utilization protein RhaD (predicted bifunctional aldolase and dehydrogenase)